MMKTFVFTILVLITPALLQGCWATSLFRLRNTRTVQRPGTAQRYPIPPRPGDTNAAKTTVNAPRHQVGVTVRPTLFQYEVAWSARTDQFVLTRTLPQIKPLEKAHKVTVAITLPALPGRQAGVGIQAAMHGSTVKDEHAEVRRVLNFSPDNSSHSTIRQEKRVIHFAFGSAAISPLARVKIHSVASRIKKHHASKVSVTGYTCWIGPKYVNEKLALARAMAVVHELGRAGVRVGSISARAKCCYIDLKNPAPNRRAEILWERR